MEQSSNSGSVWPCCICQTNVTHSLSIEIYASSPVGQLYVCHSHCGSWTLFEGLYHSIWICQELYKCLCYRELGTNRCRHGSSVITFTRSVRPCSTLFSLFQSKKCGIMLHTYSIEIYSSLHVYTAYIPTTMPYTIYIVLHCEGLWTYLLELGIRMLWTGGTNRCRHWGSVMTCTTIIRPCCSLHSLFDSKKTMKMHDDVAYISWTYIYIYTSSPLWRLKMHQSDCGS